MEEVELLYRVNGEVDYGRFVYNIFKIIKFPICLSGKVTSYRWIIAGISTLAILILFLSFYRLNNDVYLSFFTVLVLSLNTFFHQYSRTFMIDIFTNFGVSIMLFIFSFHVKKKLSFTRFVILINLIGLLFLLIYPSIILFITSFVITYAILFKSIEFKKRVFFVVLTSIVFFAFFAKFISPNYAWEMERRNKLFNLENTSLTLPNIANFKGFNSFFNMIFFPTIFEHRVEIFILIVGMPFLYLKVKKDFNSNFFYLLSLTALLLIILSPLPFLNSMYFSQITPFYCYPIIFSIISFFKKPKKSIQFLIILVFVIFTLFYLKNNLESIFANLRVNEINELETMLGIGAEREIPIRADLESILILYHSNISGIYTDNLIYCSNYSESEGNYLKNSKNGMDLLDSYFKLADILKPKFVALSIFCENETVKENVYKEFEKIYPSSGYYYYSRSSIGYEIRIYRAIKS